MSEIRTNAHVIAIKFRWKLITVGAAVTIDVTRSNDGK